MPFTAQELANVSNAVLDQHIRGAAMSQVLQERPLFKKLMSQQKTFAGGQGLITKAVKGQYTTAVQGYNHDDTVGYTNPANIRRMSAKWYELHAGIALTATELKIAGISMLDTMNMNQTTNHSQQEVIQLTNLLEDKVDDMMEGFARSFTQMLWLDGTQDAKAVAGIRSFILDNPAASGSTFGIDRGSNTWWRNRASLNIDVSTATNQNLVNRLQNEVRQLRRYGGKPDLFLCGSDFLDGFEKELRARGNYTLEGWANKGTIDASIADVSFKGVMLQYEPVLDDLGYSKYGYMLDTKHLMLMVMDGEDRKIHTPARPPEKYVMYRAITWTGALICDQLNAQGVYSIL
jgi:hypothetical protein